MKTKQKEQSEHLNMRKSKISLSYALNNATFQMTLLDLSGVGNSIGGTGKTALMNCLDKIKKLKINED